MAPTSKRPSEAITSTAPDFSQHLIDLLSGLRFASMNEIDQIYSNALPAQQEEYFQLILAIVNPGITSSYTDRPTYAQFCEAPARQRGVIIGWEGDELEGFPSISAGDETYEETDIILPYELMSDLESTAESDGFLSDSEDGNAPWNPENEGGEVEVGSEEEEEDEDWDSPLMVDALRRKFASLIETFRGILGNWDDYHQAMVEAAEN